eukprot:13256227-Ditylum_brightwellii.AAC.1
MAKHFYKPGGTLCIIQGDINSRKLDQGAEKYSHWSYVKFAACNATVIAVITVYKPCIVTKTTGITTYHQQLVLQQSETTTTINPPKAFTHDLLKWMLLRKRKGDLTQEPFSTTNMGKQ